MSRLIREEDVLKVLTKEELLCGTFTEAKIAVGDIPTAYDVEAVVRELEEQKITVNSKPDEVSWSHALVWNRAIITAIEIVRGGRDEG